MSVYVYRDESPHQALTANSKPIYVSEHQSMEEAQRVVSALNRRPGKAAFGIVTKEVVGKLIDYMKSHGIEIVEMEG